MDTEPVGVIARLMHELGKLPGIGPKSAERLAHHLLQAPRSEVFALADALRAVKEQIRPCQVCCNPTESDLCAICADGRRDLEFAALLHDVGKIAIPKAIINKPGTLDAAERELVKTHAAEGQRMLARVGGFMLGVGEIVRSHHERWDGRGYPDGLVAEEAPLAARIITCCDSWSAMRTDRPYRRAMSHEVRMISPTVISAHTKHTLMRGQTDVSCSAARVFSL